MKLSAWNALSAFIFLAAVLNGCGGCQPGSVPDAEESTEKRPAAAAGGSAAPTKPAAAPMPGARDLPTMKAQPPAARDGGMDAGGETADEAAEGEEPEEADCSVIADADPDFGEPPLAVQFSVDYECTEGGATVSWDFGDGGTNAGEENPTHSYREAGEYTAVVTVTTPDGLTATDEVDITVESEDGSVPDVEPENP